LGGFGARLVAKRLPVEEHETLTVLPANSNEVRAVAHRILESIGNITNEFSFENPDDKISAIVGSGNKNLNPTIVHIVFLKSTEDSTNISIRAIAKEGMVKQDSAVKAAQRIENLLTKPYAEQINGR